MNKDLKISFEKFQNKESVGYIKSSEKPSKTLTSEQKVILNRKGNVLFNQGDIEQARRIFLTTGYSDGLVRVGDLYVKNNRDLEALKLYMLAHNQQKSEALIKKVAALISQIIKEE